MNPVGRFEGLVYHEWINGGDEFRLLKDLSFIDHAGEIWKAPKGWTVNRNAIPTFVRFWVADPFCAKCRRATAVFSYHCKVRKKPSAQVYRMYDEAMRADGVPWRQRYFTICGLKLFGPKW
jgi:hypothetical protein